MILHKKKHAYFKIKLFVNHSLIPLIFGGLLYVLFRSTTLRLFEWFSLIGLEDTIHFARNSLFEFKNHFPYWTYYSLPDGLWAYSLTSVLLILWDGRLTYWLFLPLFTGTFVEIAQGLKMFPGTFDIVDLTFTILALLLSIIIINYKFKQNDKKNY